MQCLLSYPQPLSSQSVDEVVEDWTTIGPPESRGGTETAAFVIEEGQAVSSSSMRLAGQHRADIRAGGRGTMWIEAEIMHE